MGDMAVSNSIGSNVFDILIGLGLPWALQTLAVDYGSYVSEIFSLVTSATNCYVSMWLVAQSCPTLQPHGL